MIVVNIGSDNGMLLDGTELLLQPTDSISKGKSNHNFYEPFFILRIKVNWKSLQWRHKGRDGVSNDQPRDCLLSRSIRRRSKNTSKLRVTGLCAGNSPVTGEFPAQMASNAEYVSIWWRHHVYKNITTTFPWGQWVNTFIEWVSEW